MVLAGRDMFCGTSSVSTVLAISEPATCHVVGELGSRLMGVNFVIIDNEIPGGCFGRGFCY